MDWRCVEDLLRDYFRRDGYSIHTVTGDTIADKEDFSCDCGESSASHVNLTELAMHLAREMEYAA